MRSFISVFLTLYLSALLTLSLDSHSINAFRAISLAFKFFLTISDAVTLSRAGNLLLKTFGRTGLKPKTNWFGEKPELLSKAFLADTAQARAVCTSHLASSEILLTIVPKTPFNLSQIPLLQGLSAAVDKILILKASPKALSSSLLNSSPLSIKNFLGAPNMTIQLTKSPFMMVEGNLLFITVAVQNLVAMSTMTKKICLFQNFRSIETDSLNFVAIGILTTGRAGTLLYCKQ